MIDADGRLTEKRLLIAEAQIVTVATTVPPRVLLRQQRQLHTARQCLADHAAFDVGRAWA